MALGYSFEEKKKIIPGCDVLHKPDSEMYFVEISINGMSKTKVRDLRQIIEDFCE